MPPWLSLSAIKDAVIVVAILALGVWVYHSGENAVHVKDMKSLQQQMQNMAQTTARWQQQQEKANAVQSSDLAKINSGVVVPPLHVSLCVPQPAGATVLSGTAAASTSHPPGSRADDVPTQRDIGPAVQAFERDLETDLAQCRAVISEWPK